MNNFRAELEGLINRYSLENGSNTPDFILAQFVDDCLHSFDAAVNARSSWYGAHQFENVNRPTAPLDDASELPAPTP